MNQTDLKGSFTDLQEDGEGRELYTSEVNIELVSHHLAVSEATPLVEAAQTGQDLDIRSEDGLLVIVENQSPSRTFGPLHSGELPRLICDIFEGMKELIFQRTFLFIFHFGTLIFFFHFLLFLCIL